MVFVEFRDLVQTASKSEKDFLSALNSRMECHGINGAIRALKASGICVDQYGTGKHKSLLEKCLQYLIHVSHGSEEVKLLLREIALWEVVFERFRKVRRESGVEDGRESMHIAAFLIALEQSLGALSEYSAGKTLSDIHKKYVMVEPSEERMRQEERTVIVSKAEQLLEDSGAVLNYLLNRGYPSEGLHQSIAVDELCSAAMHFTLLEYHRQIDFLYELWRFWDCHLRMDFSNGVITFDPADAKCADALFGAALSEFRYRNMRLSWMYGVCSAESLLPIDPRTKELPPGGLISLGEAIAVVCCDEFYASEDLMQPLQGISLSEWFRSYSVVRKLGEEHLIGRTETQMQTLARFTVFGSREFWADKFCSHGVTPKNARFIVEVMTFKRGSRDLLNCPLIPIDDYLVALPSVITQLEPSASCFSNASSRGVDAPFRGSGLEKKTHKGLHHIDIPSSELKERVDGEEYQCDVAFAVEQELFFCECKSIIQPLTPQHHYELIDKLQAATIQLNRIADHFSQRLDFVRTRLGLPSSWFPEQIHRLIIITPMIGSVTRINGCLVCDDSMLSRFLERRPPSILVGSTQITSEDERFIGQVTAKKLHAMLERPPQFYIGESMFSTRGQMHLDGLVLDYWAIEKETGEFIVGDDKLKKIADAFGVPFETLKRR